MKHNYDECYEVAQEITEVLAKHNCSMGDFHVIYNIIEGFPLILEHGVIYGGEFYESIEDLPKKGKMELYSRYCRNIDYN